MFYLSVHGGGSKIEILAFDEDCKILGRGCSGGINVLYERYQDILRHVSEAIVQCVLNLYSYGFKGKFDCVYLCFLGGSAPLQDCIRQIGYEVTAYVKLWEPYCYLLAGSLSETGCIALSGTGSFAAVCNGREDFLITGGYGTPIGDDGSSTWIGIKGINMITRAIGGWGEKTILYDFLCESLGHREDSADTAPLLKLLYPEDGAACRPIYTKFAQQVIRAAACGDGVAIDILTEAGILMAQQMLSTYRLYRTGMRGNRNNTFPPCNEQGLVYLNFTHTESPSIYACGRTWQDNSVMFDSFKQYIESYLPNAMCSTAQRTPAYAGLILQAMKRYGLDNFKEALTMLL